MSTTFVCLIRTAGLYLVLFAGISPLVSGQAYFDTPSLYGYNSLFGSARSLGMGGIQMGTGADGSALAVNPAAPGMFRKSDIQFSLMPYLNSTSNSFRDGEVSADRSGMPLGSFSLSLTSLKNETEPGDWRGGVFTVAYNRLGQFNRRTNWEGNAPLYPRPGQAVDNSILDVYLNKTNTPGYFPEDLLSSDPNNQTIFSDNFKNDLVMAYDSYLLDTSRGEFYSAIPRADLVKSGYYDERRSQGQWNFGYSANFRHQVFLGFSLGYFRSDFSSEVQYAENIVAIDPNDPDFARLQGFRGMNFQLYKNLSQKSRGINGNLGLLWKVNDAFRLSAAIQLPTLLWINEKYSPRVVTNFNGLNYWGNSGEILNQFNVTWFENEYAFQLRLPARYRAGIQWIAGKYGMLGADVEYTDLSQSRLTEGDGGYNFVSENKLIRSTFRPTLNLKTGGEVRYDNLRFRLGFSYQPGPVQSSASLRNQMPEDALFYTAGIGSRKDTWYWDVALVIGNWKTRYNYLPEIDPDVESKVTSTQLRLGIGFIL